MEPAYNPIEVEERWQSAWEAEGRYAAEPDRSRRVAGRRAGDPRGEALGGRLRP